MSTTTVHLTVKVPTRAVKAYLYITDKYYRKASPLGKTLYMVSKGL